MTGYDGLELMCIRAWSLLPDKGSWMLATEKQRKEFRIAMEAAVSLARESGYLVDVASGGTPIYIVPYCEGKWAYYDYENARWDSGFTSPQEALRDTMYRRGMLKG